MTRINTNINSLTAQQNLSKTNVLLSQALTRLSTGLRINSGKDDPAGMIAAAQLGSDIAGTNAAISNSKMAEMIIDTADSALGQITSLVNDIRTLVTQAANSAAMSPDQIAANQLQIDASLDAINRISQSTNFQGRKLLDGSLDFTTTHNINDTVSNWSAVQNLEIDTADSGLAATIPVTVSVAHQAQKAYLATSTATTDASAGSFTITTSTGSFNIAPPTGGADYTGMSVRFATSSAAGASADYVSATKVLTVTVHDDAVTDFATIQTALANSTVDSVGPTVNFVASGATAGVEFNPTLDSTTVNVAAVASKGYIRLADQSGIIRIDAKTAGTAGNINAVMQYSGTTTHAAMVNGGMVISVGSVAGEDSTAAIAAAITNDTDYTGTVEQAGTFDSTDDAATKGTATATVTGTTALALTLTAVTPGTDGKGLDINITVSDDAAAISVNVATNGDINVSFGNANNNTVQTLLDAITNATGSTMVATDAGQAATAINTLVLDDGAFTAITAGAADPVSSETATIDGAAAKTVVASVLNTGGTGLAEDILFMATGSSGSHLFDFDAGTALTLVRDAINQWSDGTGVTSRITLGTTTTNLIFESSDFGSAGKVSIDVREGGSTFKNNMVDRDGVNTVNSAGTDIDAKVNGVVANGVGNTLSIDTPALAMSMTVNDPTTLVPTPSAITFTITGGGAHFQIGPNVVSTQKAVIGIQSVDTANMNTTYGRLYQLHSGENADLSTDLGKTLAGKIITAVAGKISILRGRLGAFSKTTLDTNIATLGATVNSLTNAQSTIQDADFAAETAALTRAQVLTQSGTAVLQIANRGPQNVLALLQNL